MSNEFFYTLKNFIKMSNINRNAIRMTRCTKMHNTAHMTISVFYNNPFSAARKTARLTPKFQFVGTLKTATLYYTDKKKLLS